MTLSRDGRYNYVELIAGMPTIVLIVAFLIYELLVVLLALFPINIAVIFFHWDLLMDSNIHSTLIIVHIYHMLITNMICSILRLCHVHHCCVCV